jgi:predicted nucleic acid-binding protein
VTRVPDRSVAIARCFRDEHRPALRRLLADATEAGATAPAHWPLEVANTLLMAERRTRTRTNARGRFLAFLRDLPVALDEATAVQAWGATALPADRHRLTVYDAAPQPGGRGSVSARFSSTRSCSTVGVMRPR